MICWYCYWGWPKQIVDIYMKALQDLGGNEGVLHYGPAHIVWDDENFDSAEWCLAHFDEFKRDYDYRDLEIVKRSLIKLTKLPMNIRCIEPVDYDGQHPELYPPPKDIEMVKI